MCAHMYVGIRGKHKVSCSITLALFQHQQQQKVSPTLPGARLAISKPQKSSIVLGTQALLQP